MDFWSQPILNCLTLANPFLKEKKLLKHRLYAKSRTGNKLIGNTHVDVYDPLGIVLCGRFIYFIKHPTMNQE
jgi:hypothetical protein